MDYLISQGAELNKATNDPGHSAHGKTALHWAVDGDHKTVVDSLLQAGATIDTLVLQNKKFTDYLTALIDDNNVALAQVLAKNKTILMTPINSILCTLPLHRAAQQGRLDIIKVILQAHPDLLNQKDENNQTPLLWAASRGHKEVVDYLISLGADLNAATSVTDIKHSHHGRTTLYWAVDGDHKTVGDSLLQAGATIDTLVLQNKKLKDYQIPVRQASVSSVSETFFQKSQVKKRLEAEEDDFDWVDEWTPLLPQKGL